MGSDQKYQLEEFIFDLTEIQASDILAHVDFSKKDIFETESLQSSYVFPLDAEWNAVLKNAILNKRQSDTDTLCLAVDGVEWEYKSKKVVSPLWLIPVSYKINKVKHEIELTADLENALFNPFVKNELKRRYDLVWEEADTEFPQRSIVFYDFLAEKGFSFAPRRFKVFGNFHHHRFQIVKDLEALTKTELNPLVKEMLGDLAGIRTYDLRLTKENLVPADKDQKAVFRKVTSGNLVIQGPPGTGKSQVLTNLLAKLLDKGKMSLVVSEKKAALEVLVKKLEAHGLDAFAFISHNQSKPADFIAKLRATWQILETKPARPQQNLLLSEQLLSQLQLTIDKLNSKALIGGIGLSEFRKLTVDKDLSDIPYTSDVPTAAEWLFEKAKTEAMEKSVSSLQILKHFRQKGLAEATGLDQTLLQLQSDFTGLTQKLDFKTFAELETRIRQVARCQILENESYKKYAKLFSNKRERQKFEKLRIAFLQQKAAFELLQNENSVWNAKPALSTAQSWKAQLSGNWWTKRKAIKQIQRTLTSSAVLPEIAVDNWLKYLEQENQLQQTVSSLQAMEIDRPELELEGIQYLLKQLESEDSNELNQVAHLAPGLRKALIETGSALQQKYRDLKNVLHYELSDAVLETIADAIKTLPEILKIQEGLQTIPASVYRLLSKHHVEYVERQILHSNWVQFESHFPELSKFDGPALKKAIDSIIATEAEEQRIFGQKLIFGRHRQFALFHELLRMPVAKLKPEEKLLKSKLKSGKAILVKEFAKTRQHKTIRELLDSDARAWIEIMTPIWLSTTAQVAAGFPMETGLFHHVVFDEASQIPLSHALGSLQRAQHAVVAGDEQQMSPGNYFSGNATGIDLLHQASYHWEKSPLKHHYRSAHPELIAFSNRFFYANELIAYPSAERKSAPVQIHHVPEAIYDQRQNIEEAKAVARHIEKIIRQPDSIGIVAFSEQQLDCIWKQLSPSIQDQLNERIDAGTAFFRALEQVQGDECDQLVISLGYGKNPEGEFQMRFGPLNQKNGSKRLNVLFSRARKSLDMFTSVKSYDLSLSTNEAVNLLRFFLQENETEKPLQDISFPYGLKPVIDGRKLRFEDLMQHLPDAEELVVLQDVLEKRGWELVYSL